MANITGTNGNDTLNGTNSADTISGLDGDDIIRGRSGRDSLLGGDDDDTLFGASGADTLEGGDGDDFIDPGINNDLVDGGAGNDTITYENSGNNITLNVDLASGTAFLNNNTTETFSNIENIIGSNTAGGDTIAGDAADNSLTGLDGTDSLVGRDGADTLDGGDGADTLDGGNDNDTLTGGDGSDLFIWDGTSNDTITDFGVGNTGSTGDSGVLAYTGDNDFVDLAGVFNPTTLAAYNAAAGTSFSTPLQALNHDLIDSVISFNGTDLSGPTLTLTGVSSLAGDETGVVCFAAGTLIATPRGEIPIERLRSGDLVLTMDNGPQPLAMSASRQLKAETLAMHPQLKPILVQPGAFGHDRELIVSPQHGLLVKTKGEELLARATHLADMPGGKVRRMEGCRGITYVHLVFDKHQVIFANGRPTESLYPGPQALKAMSAENRSEFEMIFPDMVGFLQAQHDDQTQRSWLKAREYSKRKHVVVPDALAPLAI